MTEPEDRWNRLSSAAKAAGAGNAPCVPAPNREEIRRKVAALRGPLREMLIALLWRRWSLAVIAVSLLAAVTVWLLAGGGPASPPATSLPIPPLP